jgi:hypothetical protein
MREYPHPSAYTSRITEITKRIATFQPTKTIIKRNKKRKGSRSQDKERK